MSSPVPDPPQLQLWLQKMHGGDNSAANELLRCVLGRLERLTRKLLDRYPKVRRWVEADDVLQNALIRLMRTLRHLDVGSVRDFFGLAAEQIRRELIDMARHYCGAHGCGTHETQGVPASGLERAICSEDAVDLERWSVFHEAVAKLPTLEREVVNLVFYYGWSQAQVAELLNMTERTVRRHWHSAQMKLREKRAGERLGA
jgi:RNA polymerase sigma-70 factor (ECF subfamily)